MTDLAQMLRDRAAAHGGDKLLEEAAAEIHRLRAELETEKGRAEFYRVTRNWSLQKTERLAEALRLAEEHIDGLTPDWYSAGQRVLAAIRAALRPTAAQGSAYSDIVSDGGMDPRG